MRYAVLLKPHANTRYRLSSAPLQEKELQLMLKKLSPDASAPVWEEIAGVPALVFEGDYPVEALREHSELYLLCEYRADGLLRPLGAPVAPVLGEDLSGILKYKGKTNEQFTRFCIHMARLSMCCEAERLVFVDPMCGKGTSLFEALNMGMDAYGTDADAASVREGLAFYKKYLEFHHEKHTQKQTGMTLPGKKSAQVQSITAQRAGELRMAACDAEYLPFVYGKGKAHLLYSDLPYGIQHAPTQGGRMTGLRDMVHMLAPAIAAVLCPGGAAVLSFNVHTLPRAQVEEELARAGLSVCQDEVYRGTEHWVEQAVTRDLCVAVKTITSRRER